MIVFSLDDQQRSIRRFVMNAFGSPPWRVRVGRARVADEDRPVAVIESVAPAVTLQARTTIPQGDVQRQQTIAVSLYPTMVDDAGEPLSEQAAGQAAASAAERLSNALLFGLVFDDGTVLSAPLRIPVYDFSGVPLTGPTRAGPDEPYGWLDVEDAPVRALVDPDDVRRWTVTGTLRVSWWQSGRIRPPAPTASTMPGAAPGGFGAP